MYCSKCGLKFTENSNFCSACGNSIKSNKLKDENSNNKELIGSILAMLFIFTLVFFVVLVINQISYGSCFKGYCLSAAFPKVAIISAIITGIFYAATSSK